MSGLCLCSLSRAASTRNGRQRSAAASQTGGEPAGPVDSAAGCQEKGTPSESQQEARLNNADAEAVTEAKPRDAGAGNHRSEKFAGTRRRCGSLPHPRRAAARMTWLGGAEPCLEEGPAGARSTSGGPRGGGRGGTGSRQLTPHRNNCKDAPREQARRQMSCSGDPVACPRVRSPVWRRGKRFLPGPLWLCELIVTRS